MRRLGGVRWAKSFSTVTIDGSLPSQPPYRRLFENQEAVRVNIAQRKAGGDVDRFVELYGKREAILQKVDDRDWLSTVSLTCSGVGSAHPNRAEPSEEEAPSSPQIGRAHV